MSALIPFDSLPQWRKQFPSPPPKIVATNGCFDILHVGHLRYLQEAKSLGDFLIVGVNSDQAVRQLKGPSRPLNSEQERAELLAALKVVDAVSIFDSTTATAFLQQVQADVYVKGGDYTLEELNQEEVAAVRQSGGTIKILPLVPGKSTTALVEKMTSS